MFSLLSQALASVVAGILLMFQLEQWVAAAEQLKTAAQAQYMQTLQYGADLYVNQFASILDTIAAGSTTPATLAVTINGAQTSVPVASALSPTVQELVSLNFLPGGFSATPPMRQPFTLQLTPVDCPGSQCHVSGYWMTTTAYKDGSGAVRSDMVADVVANTGNDAGASYTTNPATVIGFGNTWQIPNPVPGSPAAVLLMRVGWNQGSGDGVYYRLDGKYPITAAFNGGGQNIDDVVNVNATGAVNGQAMYSNNGGQTSEFANDGAGNTRVYQNGAMQILVSGTSNYAPLKAGAVTSSSTLQAANVAVPAAACSPNGLIAANSDGTGQIMSCQRGIWLPIGGRWQREGYQYVSNGSVVASPVCSAGGTPFLQIVPQDFYINNTATANFGPATGTGPWVVSLTDGNNQALNGTAVAETFCAY